MNNIFAHEPARNVSILLITWSGNQTVEEDWAMPLMWPTGPGPCNVDMKAGWVGYYSTADGELIHSHSCFAGPMLRTVERLMIGLTNVASGAVPTSVPTCPHGGTRFIIQIV